MNGVDDLTIFEVSAGRRCRMAQGRMGSLILKRMNMVLVIGCVFVLLSGCSSRLRTTMGSSSEATKVDVAQLKPEQLVAEEIVARPNPKNPVIDIPVEPARPVMQREFASDIHATPKTADVSSEIGAPLESAPASSPPGEQIVSSMSEPTRQQPMAGIPPISIEPEMPALPKPAYDEVSSASQESPVAQASVLTTPEPSAENEPMQIAKVMPRDPGMVEMTTETLEAALSDIYFDYDQFLIRDDAMLRLQVDAQLLTSKFAGKHIVIEGHCDERGTQSYNMVLGKRRARAVKSFLEDLGVPAENLQAVSYGKDKPFCKESTQDCWQENRRGHFLIQ
jgi:peptidoglycan-associated lipoprotein